MPWNALGWQRCVQQTYAATETAYSAVRQDALTNQWQNKLIFIPVVPRKAVAEVSKNRKPIGEIGCCESGMAERSHWWTERWLRSPLFLSLSLTIYLPTYLFHVFIYRSISLSLSFIKLPIYLSIYPSIYLTIYLSPSSVYLSSCLSICLPVYLWCSVIQCNVV